LSEQTSLGEKGLRESFDLDQKKQKLSHEGPTPSRLWEGFWTRLRHARSGSTGPVTVGKATPRLKEGEGWEKKNREAKKHLETTHKLKISCFDVQRVFFVRFAKVQ